MQPQPSSFITHNSSLLSAHLDTWTSAVKAKSSAGRGNGKATEFYGIKKLRELILELAFRGLLVPQNPEDEPASELLKRINNERSRLIKNGRLKKQKELPKIYEAEKPFAIPPSWGWIRLGNATNYGICDKAEATDVDEHTWVLELEDVEKTTSKLLRKVRFSERRFKSSKNRFQKSDVIYGKLRPYLDKVLIADEPGVCTTEMIPVTAYAAIDPEFLRLSLKSPYFIKYANDSTHGMNLPRIVASLGWIFSTIWLAGAEIEELRLNLPYEFYTIDEDTHIGTLVIEYGSIALNGFTLEVDHLVIEGIGSPHFQGGTLVIREDALIPRLTLGKMESIYVAPGATLTFPQQDGEYYHVGELLGSSSLVNDGTIIVKGDLGFGFQLSGNGRLVLENGAIFSPKSACTFSLIDGEGTLNLATTGGFIGGAQTDRFHQFTTPFPPRGD